MEKHNPVKNELTATLNPKNTSIMIFDNAAHSTRGSHGNDIEMMHKAENTWF